MLSRFGRNGSYLVEEETQRRRRGDAEETQRKRRGHAEETQRKRRGKGGRRHIIIGGRENNREAAGDTLL
jgi:hypothetical protein